MYTPNAYCKFFMTPKGCRYGEECRFIHQSNESRHFSQDDTEHYWSEKRKPANGERKRKPLNNRSKTKELSNLQHSEMSYSDKQFEHSKNISYRSEARYATGRVYHTRSNRKEKEFNNRVYKRTHFKDNKGKVSTTVTDFNYKMPESERTKGTNDSVVEENFGAEDERSEKIIEEGSSTVTDDLTSETYISPKDHTQESDICRSRESRLIEHKPCNTPVERVSTKDHKHGKRYNIMKDKEISQYTNKPCRFWVTNFHCDRGESCLFLHPFSDVSASKELATDTGIKKIILKENEGKGIIKDNGGVSDVINGGNVAVTIDCSDITRLNDNDTYLETNKCKDDCEKLNGKSNKEDTCDLEKVTAPNPHHILREREIKQLEKRFKNVGCLQKLESQQDSDSYGITWYPTDPDWPFVVKSFIINLEFPAAYPEEMFSASLQNSEDYPNGFSSYMTKEMGKWIDERKEKRELDDLAVRPFFKWFDKNLVDLFTKTAKQIKRDQEAKRAGFEFIPFNANATRNRSLPNKEKEVIELKSTGDIPPVHCNDDLDSSLNTTEDNKGLQILMGIRGSAQSENIDDEGKPPKEAHCGSGSEKLLSLSAAQTGTEVRLGYVGLSENIASLLFTAVDIEVECRRCSTRSTLLVKGGKHSDITCQKCRTLQSLTYQPNLLHQFSSTVGFLKPVGCKPFDLILVTCLVKLCCLTCNKESDIKGLMYGQPRSHWCIACHKKMEVELNACKFIDHSPKLAEKQLKQVSAPKPKVPREPGIHEGQPLPDKGTCKHYKKSFRWLRFPCCGKCYPCDVCHDEKEDHEMKFAGRMICGFCSKEQPFHMEKPCLKCGTHLKKGWSSHWEGGVGCRNQIKMSRNDKHKYSGKNKTVANKPTKPDTKSKKSGQKTA